MLFYLFYFIVPVVHLLSKKDMGLTLDMTLSKFLTCPVICGSLIHKSVISSSFLYPIKHLKFFFAQANLLDTVIISISTTSIAIRLLEE